MGDVKPRLRQAQQMINAGIGIVLRCSHVYESKAWGFTAADDFKNQAMEVDTDLRRKGAYGRTLFVAADRHRHHFLR